jgi:hypothetical protein
MARRVLSPPPQTYLDHPYVGEVVLLSVRGLEERWRVTGRRVLAPGFHVSLVEDPSVVATASAIDVTNAIPAERRLERWRASVQARRRTALRQTRQRGTRQ